MNQITTIKIERIDSALALIAAILKTFIMNSNFDGWKLTTSAFRSNLYFPAEFLGNQGFLWLYNYSLYVQTYNM